MKSHEYRGWRGPEDNFVLAQSPNRSGHGFPLWHPSDIIWPLHDHQKPRKAVQFLYTFNSLRERLIELNLLQTTYIPGHHLTL